MTAKGQSSSSKLEKAVLLFLAAILVISWFSISTQMFKPDSRRQNIDSVIQDCLGIISSAQKWYRASTVMGGAERKSWTAISFNRLGYEEGVNPDGRTMSNLNARYTIRVDEIGSSFDLIAEKSDGTLVIYRHITDAPPPDPEIR